MPVGEITERFCSSLQLLINVCSKPRENLFLSVYIYFHPNVIKVIKMSGSKIKHILLLVLISHLSMS